MDNQDTKQELVLAGILQPNETVNVKFKKRLEETPDLLQRIMWCTSFLEYDADIKTRLQCIIQNITEQPRCSVCNKIVKMRIDGKYRNTFPLTCGSKCFSGLSQVKEKRKRTNLRLYNATNYLTSIRGKQQTKKTLKEKYDVTNACLIPGALEKRKQTILQKYGSLESYYNQTTERRRRTMEAKYNVGNSMLLSEFKNKQSETVLKNYHVPNVWHDPSIQLKRSDTMQQLYGVDYPFQNEAILEQFKKTMNERYGVDHALQNETIKEQFKNTMLKKYNVPHALQINVPKESLEKLNDAEWLRSQHHTLQKTLTKIAEELEISQTTVGSYFRKHDIPILTIPSSQGERDLVKMICDILPGEEVITNSQQVIPPYELDVFIPKKRLAFEYNGIFWHSELQGKSKHYHLNKTKQCNKRGIRLVHIFEHEWMIKQNIVISRINSLLNMSSTIYARKCAVVRLDSEEKSTFLNRCHIQGNCPSSINYGLLYDDRIVAVMTFSKSRFSRKHQYELLRYANDLNHNIVGGASRLFKHFVEDYSPTSAITYSDKRWNTGKLYTILGFTFLHATSPNYFYFKHSTPFILHSRNAFQKHKLKNKLENFNPDCTEWENMQNNRFNRIWDCGNDVFEWRVN